MKQTDDIDIPITLRAGVEHRHTLPNFVVVSHVYKQKPRLKWIAPELTLRQREVLDMISRHVAAKGYPPTRSDICKAFGFGSPNAAETHLRALERRGAIVLDQGTARGIRVVAPRAEAAAPDSDRICPACKGVFANALGVRLHFGHRHSHLPWPWVIGKPESRTRPRRAPAGKATFPVWRD